MFPQKPCEASAPDLYRLTVLPPQVWFHDRENKSVNFFISLSVLLLHRCLPVLPTRLLGSHLICQWPV